MQNTDAFDQGMFALGETFGMEISAFKLRIYQEALKDFSDEQIQMAMGMAIKGLKFFPKPVELIELMQGNPEENAVEAWGLLLETIKTQGAYKSIMFADAKIGHCVEMMGGWPEVCRMRVEETGMRCAQFQKIYRACPVNVPQKQLAGIEEQHRTLEGRKWVDRLTEIKPVMVGRNGYERLPEIEGPGKDEVF